MIFMKGSVMSKEKFPPQKVHAFTSFLYEFAKSGYAAKYLAYSKEVKREEFDGFEDAFIKFVSNLNSFDPSIARSLSQIYSPIFGKGFSLTSTDSMTKPSRVFRLSWLDSLMKMNRLNPIAFMNELEYFLLTESSLTLISELIVASFDAIATSILRKDDSRITNAWKTFILKRLPQCVKNLVYNSPSQITPAQVELVISQAFIAIPKDTFSLIQSYFRAATDNFEEMFAATSASVSNDFRFELLKSLITIHVVPQDALFRILDLNQNSGINVQINPVNIEALQNQGMIIDSSNNSFLLPNIAQAALHENVEYTAFEESNIVKLVFILEDFEGIYQERIAREIVIFVSSWIQTQNTHNLARLVQALLAKPTTIDVLLLNVPIHQLIAPLVSLLDNWNHDEEETNFQDVFTDFGTILLMVLFVYHRYNLDLVDLGIQPPSAINLVLPTKNDPNTEFSVENNKNRARKLSFVASIIRQVGNSEELDDLRDGQSELIGGWISALFDFGGISDDLMKQSSVKDLYFLVPTLFKQAIAARAMNIIEPDTLRGGLDYFLQPFLIPTLVPLIRWICNSLWQEQDIPILLQVIQSLLLTECDGEALRLRQTVLAITGRELFIMLNGINMATGNMAMSNNPDAGLYIVEPRLWSLLEPYYTGGSQVDFLLSNKPSLMASIKQQVNTLVNWQSSESLPPVFYSNLVPLATQQVGATRVLLTLLDAIDAAKNTGHYEATIETVGSLVTMPSVRSNNLYLQMHDSNILAVILDYTPAQILKLRSSREAFKKRQEEIQRMEESKAASLTNSTNPTLRVPKQYNTSVANGKNARTTKMGINSQQQQAIGASKPANSTNEGGSNDLTEGFIKLQQYVQSFHARRRNMETIVAVRAEKLANISNNANK